MIRGENSLFSETSKWPGFVFHPLYNLNTTRRLWRKVLDTPRCLPKISAWTEKRTAKKNTWTPLRGKQRCFFWEMANPNPHEILIDFWNSAAISWMNQAGVFFRKFFKPPSPEAVFSSYSGTLKNFEKRGFKKNPNPCCPLSIEAPWFLTQSGSWKNTCSS